MEDKSIANRLTVSFIFRILKASQAITKRLVPVSSSSKVIANVNLTMLSFLVKCFLVFFKELYRRQKEKLLSARHDGSDLNSYDHLPRRFWKNEYPIVLVHGFFGFAPDETAIFGDYWSNFSDPKVARSHGIYQAHVNPLGSMHDRACELYQQLVGIFNLKKINKIGDEGNDEESNRKLTKIVYGEDHSNQFHTHQTYYKPFYLRQVCLDDQKIYAFPCGLPGGWDEHQKVHFIGHSQGAQTIRYLQYLMSIDYFNTDPNTPKQDKSHWFASITSIQGCLNGNMSGESLGIPATGFDKESKDNFSLLMQKVMKLSAVGANAFAESQTMDKEQIKLQRVIKVSSNSDEFIYQLDNQDMPIGDLNYQGIGLNRRKNETFQEYVQRIQESEAIYTSDRAIPDMFPETQQHTNAKLSKTSNHTYYFTMATGERKINRHKAKEQMTQVQNASEKGIGFDSEVTNYLKLQGNVEKKERYATEKATPSESFWNFIRNLSFPIAITNKVWHDGMVNYEPPQHLDNLRNSQMNNVQAIDYSNRDLMTDTDNILPRWNSEHPRISSSYKSKADIYNQPWGHYGTPQQFDATIDAALMQLHEEPFQKGVWYHSSFSQVEHNDFAGPPAPVTKAIGTMIGKEFRPQFCINTLNRLRLLDFDDKNFRLQAAFRRKGLLQTKKQVSFALPVEEIFD